MNQLTGFKREEKLATLKEVAERSGVSIKTVSRIVNGDPGVSQRTRDVVQASLDELGYVPNEAARMMRIGVSSVYGFMTDIVTTTPFSVDIVAGAQSVLNTANQTLLIASSGGDPAREEELWRMFRSHRVAGVIYAAMFHREHTVRNKAFDGRIVLANCFSAEGGSASIVPDDEDGGYVQARHLLQLGHRRVGLIPLIPDIVATRLRRKGMLRAFAEAGVQFDTHLEEPGFVGNVGSEEIVAYAAANKLLSQRNRPTAIMCGNDTIAVQAYLAAGRLGLRVPENLSLIGYDDLKLISETLVPTLTTVALPHFEIGRRAAQKLSATASSDKGTGIARVRCQLVERHSCRAIT